MNDSLSMNMLQAIDDLIPKVSQFWWGEGAAVSQKLKKIIRLAHLESEASTSGVGNLPQKLDNIWVAHEKGDLLFDLCR
jgi:hypothetical protein